MPHFDAPENSSPTNDLTNNESVPKHHFTLPSRSQSPDIVRSLTSIGQTLRAML